MDRDQIVKLYSDLNDVVFVDGLFDQVKESDLIEDISYKLWTQKNCTIYIRRDIFYSIQLILT